MTTQPGDETAAGPAARGHLRASHADREQVVSVLKAAFVAGMLAKDEFDLRVGRAFASRTCAELAALTADLPAGLAAIQPPKPARPPARVRRPLARAAAKSGVCLTITAATVLGGELLIPGDGGPQLWGILMILLAVSSLWTAVGIMACAVVTSLDQRPSRRQRPPRPGPDGHALEAEQRPGPGDGPVRANLCAHQPQQRIPARATRAPRGIRPARGAPVPRAT